MSATGTGRWASSSTRTGPVHVHVIHDDAKPIHEGLIRPLETLLAAGSLSARRLRASPVAVEISRSSAKAVTQLRTLQSCGTPAEEPKSLQFMPVTICSVDL